MASPDEVAKQFVDFYYSTFDADRSGLSLLYRDTSVLTFQDTQHQGVRDIVGKLVGLPFQKVEHRVERRAAQPGPGGSVFILVTGQLLTDGEQHPLSYSQAFQLFQENGQWFVQNDIFMLV